MSQLESILKNVLVRTWTCPSCGQRYGEMMDSGKDFVCYYCTPQEIKATGWTDGEDAA